jgi:hypothetical protein
MVSYPLSSNVRVVVLKLSEFSDIPQLCAKAHQSDLRKGLYTRSSAAPVYVRTRKLPETAEVAASVEMREILDL